jgi:hypothetical protein
MTQRAILLSLDKIKDGERRAEYLLALIAADLKDIKDRLEWLCDERDRYSSSSTPDRKDGASS